jgi:hypothetical protein
VYKWLCHILEHILSDICLRVISPANYIEIPPHSSQNGYCQQTTTNAREDVREKKDFHTVGGNAN